MLKSTCAFLWLCFIFISNVISDPISTETNYIKTMINAIPNAKDKINVLVNQLALERVNKSRLLTELESTKTLLRSHANISNGELGWKTETLDAEVLGLVAPVYIIYYIESAAATLRPDESFDMTTQQMIEALGIKVVDLNQTIQKIMVRVIADYIQPGVEKEESLKEKITFRYVLWRLILRSTKSLNVRVLNEIRKTCGCGMEDDNLFAEEIAYLWTKTLVFRVYRAVASFKITFEVIQSGLRWYEGVVLPTTRSAIRALFMLLSGEHPNT